MKLDFLKKIFGELAEEEPAANTRDTEKPDANVFRPDSVDMFGGLFVTGNQPQETEPEYRSSGYGQTPTPQVKEEKTILIPNVPQVEPKHVVQLESKLPTMIFKEPTKPTMETPPDSVPENTPEEKRLKEMFITFILDGTYSFRDVYRGVYYILDEMRKKLNVYQSTSLDIYYGLVLIRERYPEVVNLRGKAFTRDGNVFMDAVRDLEMYGGSPDGKEDINAAVQLAIDTLSTHSEKDANRGIFCFTDSFPEDTDYTCTFNGRNGLRFAHFYMYDDAYDPILPMVDGNNKVSHEQKNMPKVTKIAQLAKADNEDIIKTVTTLMDQVSVQSV